MSYQRGPYQTRMSFGFGGPFSGPPPRDVLALLIVVFVTYSMQFFASTAVIPALLQLSPLVWTDLFVWQLVTYAFAGFGPPSLWILLELLIIYWFGRDVYLRLGRRRFWRVVVVAVALAGVAAVAVHLLSTLLLGESPTGVPFVLMQGQRTLLAILIAAFATLYAEATILFMFVLPLRAGWFLWLGPLFAFVGFLSSHDAGGFAGICAATVATWLLLSPGGPTRKLRRWWLELQQRRIESRLDHMRRKRGFTVVDGDRDRDRWVH